MEDTTGRIGTYRRLVEEPPQARGPNGAELYLHRTQTMICVYVRGEAGAAFARDDHPDESFVFALFTPLRVTAGERTVTLGPGSVAIVPPGPYRVELAAVGDAWLGLTALASDLLGQCPNGEEYATPLENVAPLLAWPEPPDGYRLRVYDLDAGPPGRPHCYRHRTAMASLTWPPPSGPRDPSALSPHHHEDFEQASLIHSGTAVHHLRRAWGRDATRWLLDEHVELVAPAIAVSKPPDVHTTQAISSGGPVGLIDLFAPPRWDFSSVEELVLNSSEYPMPAAPPPSYASGRSTYAADDPRRAIESPR